VSAELTFIPDGTVQEGPVSVTAGQASLLVNTHAQVGVFIFVSFLSSFFSVLGRRKALYIRKALSLRVTIRTDFSRSSQQLCSVLKPLFWGARGAVLGFGLMALFLL
jgi:hypothetical protein